MWKQIVVLANSVKHDPGRCIAGREVSSEDDDFGIGPWVRPISAAGEGELYPQHFVLDDGTVPQTFDVIEVYVHAPASDATQPENWLIHQDGRRWKRVHRWAISDVMACFVENPPNLWLQPGVKSDRVTKEFLACYPSDQSLYLLNVQDATVTKSGRKFRVRFSFNGTNYDLAVTDPLIANVIGEQQVCAVPRCLLCVSLAPAFPNQYDGKEYHYKLAATVIPYE
jgi:hypothetical protein